MKKELEIILKDITKYLDFLRETGYKISVSCFAEEFSPVLPTLLQYEVHLPLICHYLKTQSGTEGLCAKNKEKLKRKNITEPYYSCCYAGVEEFVFPIKNENKTLLCVNVSGYRGQLEKSEILATEISKKCDDKFYFLRELLTKSVPPMQKIEALVTPLEYMFNELYQVCRTLHKYRTAIDIAYNDALTFLYENYASKITLSDIAAVTNYANSYFCRIFHKKSKKTPIEYLNEIRLSKAAELLRNSSYNVTEVALATGFDDPDYFSTLFKRKFGVSPKKYKMKLNNP